MMYKIAVFSDIHGNYEALKSIINDFDDSYDEIIYLGDLIGVGPRSKECLDLLLSHKEIKYILGNHELYYVNGLSEYILSDEKRDNYKWLYNCIGMSYKEIIKYFPLDYCIKINNKTLLFSHYFFNNVSLNYPYKKIDEVKNTKVSNIIKLMNCDYMFYGHDHEHREYNFGDKYLCDVGSSGCVKDDNTFYTIIEINDDIKIYQKHISFNRDNLINDLKNIDFPMKDIICKGFYGIE